MTTEEVKAIPIEQPVLLGEAGKWLSAATGKVEMMVASGDFEPFSITSEDDYKQAKRTRTALNARINEIETERKSMTRTIEEAVKTFKDGAKSTLEPLTEREAQFKAELATWDEGRAARRRAELQETYADFAGELATMVSFDLIEEHYAKSGKWYLRSTSTAAAISDLQNAIQAVHSSLTTLDGMPYPADRKSRIRAKYLLSLDMAGAIAAENAEFEAAEAARAHEQAERERKELMQEEIAKREAAQMEAEQAALEAQAAAEAKRQQEEELRHAAAIKAAEEARQRRIETAQEVPQAPVTFTVEFRATVTEMQLQALRDWINAAGISAMFRRI